MKAVKATKIPLILERQENKLWGRVSINDNIIVDSASSLQSLEKKMRKLILDFENLKDIDFEYAYDLTVFFEKFNFLNQSKLAELAGINASLIRQYSSGHKQPSKEQVSKIEVALRKIADQLKAVKLSTRSLAVR